MTKASEMVEKVARAMQNADLHDGDEGNHYRLFDLLGFSGENKAVMIARQLASAAISAIDSENERLREALRAADDALRDHACHGGPSVPCLRSSAECAQECGKRAGDALLKVGAALSSPPAEGEK